MRHFPAPLTAALLLLAFSTTVRAEPPTARTISTSGEATVYVTPDVVHATLGIEVFDENLDLARAGNDRRSGTLVKAIKALGIDEHDLQIDDLRIEVQYKDNHPWEGPRGYIARRSYGVTLKETKLFERLVDAALKNGANQVMGFEFRTSQLRKYRDQARAMAIKAAKEKAIAMAKELECGVGKPWQIVEGHSDGWGHGSNAQYGVLGGAAGDNDRETFPLGKIEIRAQVSVTFDLTDK